MKLVRIFAIRLMVIGLLVCGLLSANQPLPAAQPTSPPHSSALALQPTTPDNTAPTIIVPGTPADSPAITATNGDSLSITPPPTAVSTATNNAASSPAQPPTDTSTNPVTSPTDGGCAPCQQTAGGHVMCPMYCRSAFPESAEPQN